MRIPVSEKQNRWFNGQNVDENALDTEQSYNNQIQASIINNHLGTGVLLETLTQKVLFDSDLVSGVLDGKALDSQLQPSDTNLGNQLEVELSDSAAAGKRCIKLCIIGIDFDNNLQYDRLTFNRNEKQFISHHYAQILKILSNDFIGDPSQSLNLGGRLVIREAKSFYLSRDCVMVAQDVQPNIFFRDFFVGTGGTLNSVLNTALVNYNIDNLNITTNYLQLRELSENDVSSQVGQKFQATTNNIQKITLLLAVSNSINSADLEWTGDLIVSLFPLQSSVDCPLDIAPDTAIDFDPSNIPLAQLSLNYNSLADRGIILNETPQPVDFVFSNTLVATGTSVKTGGYYTVSMKRAGSADKCVISAASGTNRLDNSLLTLFNGSIWVDVPDEDLWFQVWTDAAKVLDGQAYDTGHGVLIPKTKQNNSTGVIEDYVLNNIPFVRNDVYYGVIDAASENSDLIQDERTGEKVFSHQQFVPSLSLVTSNDLATLEKASEALIIGNIADKNAKIISTSSVTVASNLHHYSMVGNQFILKVVDDPSDGYRYDLSVLNLITELTGSGGISNINGLICGKIVINNSNPNTYYRIADTEIISMIYGDLNGDGVVDSADLLTIQDLLDNDLNSVPSNSDYVVLTTPFQTDINLSWRLLDDDGVSIIDSGTDGHLVLNPQDNSRAVFSSISAAFDTVLSLSTKKLQILSDISNPGNNAKFKITGLTDSTTISIRKDLYTSDTILQLLRGDINGDMVVDAGDVELLTNYINKVAPFPANTSPGNKIGTTFQAIRFTLEQYVDRADEYTASGTRATAVHPTPDILFDGYHAGFSLFGTNLRDAPVGFTITKQLNWYEYFVNATANPKLVPVAFNYQSGAVAYDCTLDSVVDDRYPVPPTFDPGHNDFFLPNNLVLNQAGQILRPDGYYAKLDFEVGTVIMEMPSATIPFETEKVINIFSDFVANYSGTGRTRLGFESMRFADCSFVGLDALTLNQVNFSVSLRSFSPQLDGTDSVDIEGVIIDMRIGVHLDADSGLLTLRFTNLYEDPVLQTLKTRLQITVFLKKAGFNNKLLTVNSTQMKNLLGL